MPRTYRFAALIWQDPQGGWTARLLESDDPVALAMTPEAALAQVEDYLQWALAEGLEDRPDFFDPELFTQRVEVRPEYTHRGRRFPLDDAISVRVHAVKGRQAEGLLVCSLPTLGVRFYYHPSQSLRQLVGHYVQQILEACTPQEVARYLPPGEVRLEWVAVRAGSLAHREPRLADRVPGLVAVCEPLGDPGIRRQFSRPYERDRAVADLTRRLASERANVLLVGEPGCGKSTMLLEAVRQVERELARKKTDLPARRFWLTGGGRLIAGMKYLGQWEERCEKVIGELDDIAGYLCVESLLDLVRQGGEGPTNSLAAFFLPYLQRGELRMVGEATPAELDACRRLLPGLVDVFQVLALPPFTRSEAIKIFEHTCAAHRAQTNIEVAPGVIAMVYNLFRRFWPDGAFPGKVVAFLHTLFDATRQDGQRELSQQRVLDEFIRQTGLPEVFLRDEVPLDPAHVLEQFRGQILGQDAACQAATSLVTTFKAGMNDPSRPVGVYFFCGPTGVGKTEMARAIARFFFGQGEQGDRLIRLDMSEYTGWRAGERLLMKPDGEPGELIQRVRQQPFVVVLLDEIEKAGADVFDVLLGVLDEGRLTDRFGRTTSFKSAIIVMTSNIGAGARGGFGFAGQTAPDYEGEMMAFFRPEFFNRIDHVIIFEPLGPATVAAITRKELAAIAGREGLTGRGLHLIWDQALEAKLAREGFDERYGARPLLRTLEALVVTPLARRLLDRPGLRDATIRLGLDPAGLVTIAIEEKPPTAMSLRLE